MNAFFSDTSGRDDETLAFLEATNEQSHQYVTLSGHIFVDAIISRWYSLGRERIKMELRHYLAYNRGEALK